MAEYKLSELSQWPCHYKHYYSHYYHIIIIIIIFITSTTTTIIIIIITDSKHPWGHQRKTWNQQIWEDIGLCAGATQLEALTGIVEDTT